jgi:hypothetical protein
MEREYDFLSFQGFKSDQELKKVYEETDCLVNIGNSTNMLPSKLFAYISTGLPIIHFYNSENDPCNKLLERYTAASVISLDSVTPEKLLEEMIRIKDCRVSFDQIKKDYRNYVPDNMVDLMIL